MTLALILSIAIANMKRIFYSINFLKNRLNNRICDQWMNDNLLIYIKKDILNEIDNKLIVKHFQKNYNYNTYYYF